MTTQARPASSLRRLAAAVDPYPEGQDAAVLAAALTRATGAELMLLAIEPDLPLVIPGVHRQRLRQDTENMLKQTRGTVAAGARLKVERDLSVARGLERLVRAEHRDLLVVGSSRRGAPGEVSIGGRTRQLLSDLECALALAPRGLSARGPLALRRVGVGFDGGEEAQAALELAAAIATGAGGELIVRGVIDDRPPGLGWRDLWTGSVLASWQEMMDDEEESLRTAVLGALDGVGAAATVQLERDRPSRSLLVLSEQVDLLVIGSRRWGPLARLLLGGTGERLVRGARSSLLVVPRPQRRS